MDLKGNGLVSILTGALEVQPVPRAFKAFLLEHKGAVQRIVETNHGWLSTRLSFLLQVEGVLHVTHKRQCILDQLEPELRPSFVLHANRMMPASNLVASRVGEALAPECMQPRKSGGGREEPVSSGLSTDEKALCGGGSLACALRGLQKKTTTEKTEKTEDQKEDTQEGKQEGKQERLPPRCVPLVGLRVAAGGEQEDEEAFMQVHNDLGPDSFKALDPPTQLRYRAWASARAQHGVASSAAVAAAVAVTVTAAAAAAGAEKQEQQAEQKDQSALIRVLVAQILSTPARALCGDFSVEYVDEEGVGDGPMREIFDVFARELLLGGACPDAASAEAAGRAFMPLFEATEGKTNALYLRRSPIPAKESVVVVADRCEQSPWRPFESDSSDDSSSTDCGPPPMVPRAAAEMNCRQYERSHTPTIDEHPSVLAVAAELASPASMPPLQRRTDPLPMEVGEAASSADLSNSDDNDDDDDDDESWKDEEEEEDDREENIDSGNDSSEGDSSGGDDESSTSPRSDSDVASGSTTPDSNNSDSDHWYDTDRTLCSDDSDSSGSLDRKDRQEAFAAAQLLANGSMADGTPTDVHTRWMRAIGRVFGIAIVNELPLGVPIVPVLFELMLDPRDPNAMGVGRPPAWPQTTVPTPGGGVGTTGNGDLVVGCEGWLERCAQVDPLYVRSLRHVWDHDFTTRDSQGVGGDNKDNDDDNDNDDDEEDSPWNLDFTYTSMDAATGNAATCDLMKGGETVRVTNRNKTKWVALQARRVVLGDDGAFAARIRALRAGLFDVIPREMLILLSGEELRLLVCGNDASKVDVDDWKSSCGYEGGMSSSDKVVCWFWHMVESMDNGEHRALLSFWSGSGQPPLFGFDPGASVFADEWTISREISQSGGEENVCFVCGYTPPRPHPHPP
jgi:hypothetical protein